jgi:hypothetical protein
VCCPACLVWGCGLVDFGTVGNNNEASRYTLYDKGRETKERCQ